VSEPRNDKPATVRPVGSARTRALVEGSMWSAGALLVIALVVIVNYFGMKYYQRWDWTGSQLYSLSEKTESILAGLDRDVRATMFLQPDSNLYDPAKELLERYAAASQRFTLRTVDPQRNLIEAQRLVDEYQLAGLDVVVFEAGDDRRVVESSSLADFDYSGLQFGAQPTMTGFKGEEAFSSAVLELVEERKPKVLFTTGHGERALEDFDSGGLSRISDLLGRENLDLESWATLGQSAVPAGTDLVVVAGPRSGFLPPEIELLGRFHDAGGRLLLMLDPVLDERAGLVDTGFEAWLAERGVELGRDLVVDPSATLPFFGAETIFVRATGAHPIVESLEQAQYPVIFALARSVGAGTVPADAEVRTLLQTTADGWAESDLDNLAAVEQGEGDAGGPVTVAVALAARDPGGDGDGDDDEEVGGFDSPPLEGEEPAGEASADAAVAAPAGRLVVFGDSDFATNAQLANAGNPTLVANAFNWLLERERLLGIGPKKPEQVRLTLAPGQLAAITWGTLLGMPLLAVAAGVAVWFRRRR
jgi:ABC-type uncharacterized transport system involved in gliding motility auxiliary subunit